MQLKMKTKKTPLQPEKEVHLAACIFFFYLLLFKIAATDAALDFKMKQKKMDDTCLKITNLDQGVCDNSLCDIIKVKCVFKHRLGEKQNKEKR